MSSVFDWKGKPSIFSTDKDWANFIGTNANRGKITSERSKLAPIDLPGGSPYPPLQMMRKPK